MSGRDRHYVVNERYRNSTDEDADEFGSWINEPISGGIANSGGIRKIANEETSEREFLVFYSKSESSQNHRDPWEDIINMEEGVARYWGDAKASHAPDPDAPQGNGWVKEDYCRTYAQGDRRNAPPVLLFESTETGYVTFRGVCVITGMSVERHKDEGETAVNYRFDLAILDVDRISLEWIHQRALTGTDGMAPEAWREWVEEGRIQRYSVLKNNIRPKANQQPTGRQMGLLEDIRSKLDGPQKGKKLEYLIMFLMEGLEGFSDVELTPPTGDRGVDITGRIDLISNAHLGDADTKMDFKAQVKNRTIDSSVSGGELSRLASRIDDGEIGLFFTTSYYTEKAQKENLSSYPVRLFCGKDLVELLVQTDLTVDNRLSDDAVGEIDDKV